MLNQTTRLQVDRVRHEFFRRWPNARRAAAGDAMEMSALIKPLGLYNRRAAGIIKMSQEYLAKDWTCPTELYGLGKYAKDSYNIFVLGKSVENPADKFLSKYMEWLFSSNMRMETGGKI